VKVLKSSEEVVQEFVAEIDIISSVDHKNAMALVGFCAEHGKLMLVYDYMSRGSLEEILHGVCVPNLVKRNASFSVLPSPIRHGGL
jgi:serine/threonine protein kinase